MSEQKVVMGISEAHAKALRLQMKFVTEDGRRVVVSAAGDVWVDGIPVAVPEEDAFDRWTRGCTARDRVSDLPVTKGVHDWSRQPRVMVDECECDNPHVWGHLLTLAGMVLSAIFFLACASIGALLLARAIHDGITSGWSWSTVVESITDRLGPA